MQDIQPIRNRIDAELGKFPLYQYAFLTPDEIRFDPSLRNYCKHICGNYKTTWACPPAVGRIDQCVDRCLSYEDVLIFSTARKKQGPEKKAVYAKDRPYLDFHEQTTCEIERMFEKEGLQVYTLTSNVCRMCKKCVYPKERCRFPEALHPCIEGHGIRVDEVAEQIGIDYYLSGYSLKFTVLFYKQVTATIQKE